MMRIRKGLIILMTIIMVLGFIACDAEDKDNETSLEKSSETSVKGDSTVSFPNGTITLICPWGAGGSTDITARAIANVAEDKLGVPVVVVNRAGGSSTIGTQEVALTAEGDGTTILVATINALTILPHTLELEYSPADFKAVGQVSVRDMAIISRSSKPWNDINDFINDAKKAPGEYMIAIPQGGLQHLLFQKLCEETGIEVTVYPISGDAEGLTAILGGVADLAIPGSYNVAAGQIEAGEIKALAAFSDRPVEDLPDTPLLIDLGYDITSYPWTALLIPASTPDALHKVMQEKFKEILIDPELLGMLVKNGQTPYYLDGDTTLQTITEQYEDFGKIVDSMDL